MFKVSMTRRAEKDLRRIDRKDKNRIITVVSALRDDPRPPGCLKVQSEPGVWRIRVGDWRIGYHVDDKEMEVLVIRIANRREFYD
jgi:mRNA interferase RelE/StbE